MSWLPPAMGPAGSPGRRLLGPIEAARRAGDDPTVRASDFIKEWRKAAIAGGRPAVVN